MKKVLACAVVAIGLVLGSGGAAMAGEVNGNGDDTPIAGHDTAASICAFSGLDTADSIEGVIPFPDDTLALRGNQSPAGNDRHHGVQNYGMFQRPLAKEMGIDELVPSPGAECRGNLESTAP
ncbi:hypothetical protein [Microbacterium sp. LWH3-1.2]|uniref:hypothetical protein n=1 Tax=Microbacterium sp. LWH3-1.2 TaxID=3135256 RepID=UPI00342DC0EC